MRRVFPALREAWEAYCAAQEQGVELPCLVTGARQPIAILHGKIRGVKDAQSVGANLVSFNSSAYESYGRDKAQGLNAPVGKYAAFAYVTALNALLANSEHRLIISDTTVVFWAESANPDFQILFNAAMNPKEDNQKMLCAILEKNQPGPSAQGGRQSRNALLHPWPCAECRSPLRAFFPTGFFREPF